MKGYKQTPTLKLTAKRSVTTLYENNEERKQKILANYCKGSGKQVKGRKKNIVIKVKNVMSCGFFFLLQRKQFNNAQHGEKKKMIGRITIAINKISAKFLYETHPFYPSFLTLVPSENRKMHKQDS